MWAVYDYIKGSWDEIIYFQSLGTLVRIGRVCKEDSFSCQSFAFSPSHKIFVALRTKGRLEQHTINNQIIFHNSSF